jgi:RhoGAP domain
MFDSVFYMMIKSEDGTFGVPLEILVEKFPAKIDIGTGPNPKTVPIVIAESIRAMSTMDLRVEGIFRKNGNIKRLKTVTEALDFDPLAVNFSEDNQIQLAALIKKFLREMPEPLMTFKLHKLFISSQSKLCIL